MKFNLVRKTLALLMILPLMPVGAVMADSSALQSASYNLINAHYQVDSQPDVPLGMVAMQMNAFNSAVSEASVGGITSGDRSIVYDTLSSLDYFQKKLADKTYTLSPDGIPIPNQNAMYDHNWYRSMLLPLCSQFGVAMQPIDATAAIVAPTMTGTVGVEFNVTPTLFPYCASRSSFNLGVLGNPDTILLTGNTKFRCEKVGEATLFVVLRNGFRATINVSVTDGG